MSKLVLSNKPYGVVSQFSGDDATLADYIDIEKVYPAGRLDKDSEGLLLLTNDGQLQARIANPRFKTLKVYWVQVEGAITEEACEQLRQGIELKDGPTKPAEVSRLKKRILPERVPPIRFRKSVPTSWLSLGIREGRNRQVRRMTAAVGYPTLRLYRHTIGEWSTEGISPGEYRVIDVNFASRTRRS